MKYSDARPLIRSGDVLFWTHRPLRNLHDLQVQLVRIFTRSEWCHVAVAWVVGGRVFVLEAVSAGVRIFPLSKTGDFTWVPRGQWSSGAEEFALAHVGEPYSKWDAVRSLFNASNDKDNRWFCSEFVVAVLELDRAANRRQSGLRDKTPAGVMSYLTEHEDAVSRFVLCA